MDRTGIPLIMLPGNLDILLSNRIPCKAVSLRQDYTHNAPSVILVLHGLDREVAEKLGFKTTYTDVGDEEIDN